MNKHSLLLDMARKAFQYYIVRNQHSEIRGWIAHQNPQHWIGGCTNYLDRTYPFSECPSQVSDAEDKEREIAENIFDWWISGLGYDKWYARKFLQLKLDL